VDDALRAAIADVQQLAVSAQAAPFAAARAASVVLALRPDAEILSLWLADAVLAARLKWPLPLPLIAGALLHPSLRTGGHRPYPGDADWTLTCCLAYGHAAVAACDLFAELGRRVPDNRRSQCVATHGCARIYSGYYNAKVHAGIACDQGVQPT
jgi:hypothetical protein